MGSFVSRSMEDGMSRNREFVKELNTIMVERQLHSQNQMRERLMAMQIARARELLNWLAAFYVIGVTSLTSAYRKTKKPGFLMPVLPLTFILAYQADLSYGTKLHRIRAEAEHIMQHETETLFLPCGVPTVSSIDLARQVESERQKLHPHMPAL
ncbi:Plasminogen receptor (KT) [Frankliniella fusca]|uniref:Plasminogen receptor (KT) n=1 Tax=Frankliniella fusca TaxID=407009 RepID=A0AAE1LRI6_9NEOP|nr:Plasminogen receptor (KT) [Frankliniella fusca]